MFISTFTSSLSLGYKKKCKVRETKSKQKSNMRIYKVSKCLIRLNLKAYFQLGSLNELNSYLFLCFGIFIAMNFNICRVIWCDLLMQAVGSILGVVLECACRLACSQGTVSGCGWWCCWLLCFIWGLASRCPRVEADVQLIPVSKGYWLY